MWVAPAHRRLGVGTLLVGGVIDWVQPKGVGALTLMVTQTNERALRFYECLGFAVTGRTEPYPNDPALNELEMRRMLGPC